MCSGVVLSLEVDRMMLLSTSKPSRGFLCGMRFPEAFQEVKAFFVMGVKISLCFYCAIESDNLGWCFPPPLLKKEPLKDSV
jgi:hypothetical protein